MRLYAGILNARLPDFTEQTDARASAQAGFKPHLSTIHPLLTLQYFIDRQLHANQALYCCFLDLKSAYDYLQRPLLWDALLKLGVHGCMLDALMSLYANATVSINISGKTGEGFASLAGVKQGCPLSPTLFGLLLDGLQMYLLINCAGIGPKISNGNIVPVLMYADDTTLMATSASKLQELINATYAFCKAVGFTISAEKSSVCVFSKLPQAMPAFTSSSTVIPQSDEVKYLRLMFHSQFGVMYACSAFATRTRLLGQSCVVSMQA